MSARADSFELGQLQMKAGEGRRIDLSVDLGDFRFGADRYVPEPGVVPVRLDLSRMTGGGWALRLRFSAAIVGACMRCLGPAAPQVVVDAREVDQPGGGDELQSPYIEDETLDLRAWAHDAFALALPAAVLCREDCAGLCPDCGADLNADPAHAHERPPDPRWAKLGELTFDDPA